MKEEKKVNGTVVDHNQKLSRNLIKERTMFKKLAVIGLFTMGVVAMVPTESSASGLCIAYNGSRCLLYSGSVDVEDLLSVGVQPGDIVRATVFAAGPAWVECQNSGAKGNKPGGLQLTDASDTSTVNMILSESQVDENGKASLNFKVPPSEAVLQNLTEEGHCPSHNHSVTDAVWRDIDFLAELFDPDGKLLDTFALSCTLPRFEEGLEYDKKTGEIEKRLYGCDEVQ